MRVTTTFTGTPMFDDDLISLFPHRAGNDTVPSQPWQYAWCPDCGNICTFVLANYGSGTSCGACFLLKEPTDKVARAAPVPRGPGAEAYAEAFHRLAREMPTWGDDTTNPRHHPTRALSDAESSALRSMGIGSGPDPQTSPEAPQRVASRSPLICLERRVDADDDAWRTHVVEPLIALLQQTHHVSFEQVEEILFPLIRLATLRSFRSVATALYAKLAATNAPDQPEDE